MQSLLKEIELLYAKKAVIDVKSGDTVRVHQRIVEGGKERVQVFEGLVIRVTRRASLTSSFTVRRIASGVGVEKSFLIHSPSIVKIEVTKRSKVRRNYLSYMRGLTGKSARLSSVEFDKKAVNNVPEPAEDEIIAEDAAAAAGPLPSEAEAKPSDEKPEKTEAEKIEEQPKLRADAKNPAQEQNKQ